MSATVAPGRFCATLTRQAPLRRATQAFKGPLTGSLEIPETLKIGIFQGRQRPPGERPTWT